MFENTLLIIKNDFMLQRKCLLLRLLSKGFQIQGSRKLAFKPEDAAEFYKDFSDDKCYMLYVILLSKGTSEAFILTKYNAVQQLIDVLICFFGTSMEMDRNVHVSRSCNAARREISFIFPNYIHEPIDYFDKHKFMKQPIVGQVVSEAFNIVKKPCQHHDWRVKLSEWLLRTNSAFPHLSNQCSRNPNIAIQEKSQQTNITMIKAEKDGAEVGSIGSASTLPGASSDLMSSSSCLSCSSFKSAEPCDSKDQLHEFEKRLKMRATKTSYETKILEELPKELVCDDYGAEYVNVFEDGPESDEGVDEQNLEQTFADVDKLQTMVHSLIENAREEQEMPCDAPTEEYPPAEGDFSEMATIEKFEEVPETTEAEHVVESAAEPALVLETEAQPQTDVATVEEPEQIPKTEPFPELEAVPEPQAVENVIEPAAEVATQESGVAETKPVEVKAEAGAGDEAGGGAEGGAEVGAEGGAEGGTEAGAEGGAEGGAEVGTEGGADAGAEATTEAPKEE